MASLLRLDEKKSWNITRSALKTAVKNGVENIQATAYNGARTLNYLLVGSLRNFGSDILHRWELGNLKWQFHNIKINQFCHSHLNEYKNAQM
jgi:hypothetical protein